MTAAARDVAEAADEGDCDLAAARPSTVVTAMTDGGGGGSRKQEAAAHRHASKASKGSIAGRGAALFAMRKKVFGPLESYEPLAADRGRLAAAYNRGPRLHHLPKNTA